MRGAGGQLASSSQRFFSEASPFRAEAIMNTRTGGSSMIPLSSPLSQ